MGNQIWLTPDSVDIPDRTHGNIDRMAIEEHDREDLLRDGRTMPLRGQCVIDGVTVMIGFRAEGQLSLYCGSDPVFQFTTKGEIRRVFYQGKRYAADRGTLVELTRETRGRKVQFASNPIDTATQTDILSVLRNWLDKIRIAMPSTEADWQSIEAQPSQFHERLGEWLHANSEELGIAAGPNA